MISPRRHSARHIGLRLILLSVCTLTTLLLVGSAIQAESDVTKEYEIKAGCLFNFTQLLTWPEEAFADSTSPFAIGILGRDPFGKTLVQAIRAQHVQGREMCIRRTGGHLACQLLYVGATESKNVSLVVESTRGKPIVTVSELKGFAEQGGMIEFYLKDNTVNFAINVDALEREGLEVSEDLLKLARIVTEKKVAEADND